MSEVQKLMIALRQEIRVYERGRLEEMFISDGLVKALITLNDLLERTRRGDK